MPLFRKPRLELIQDRFGLLLPDTAQFLRPKLKRTGFLVYRIEHLYVPNCDIGTACLVQIHQRPALLCHLHSPARHASTAQLHSKPLKLLLLPIERQIIHELSGKDMPRSPGVAMPFGMICSGTAAILIGDPCASTPSQALHAYLYRTCFITRISAEIISSFSHVSSPIRSIMHPQAHFLSSSLKSWITSTLGRSAGKGLRPRRHLLVTTMANYLDYV